MTDGTAARTSPPGDRSYLVRVSAIAFLQATAVLATVPMVSYRALELGASTGQVGLVGASFAALSALAAVPIGRWTDRWGSPRMTAVGAVMMAGPGAVLPVAPSLPALAVTQMVLGLGYLLCTVGLQTFVTQYGPAYERERRIGAYFISVSLGLIAGPLLLAVLAGALDFSTPRVFVVALAIQVSAGVLVISLAGIARRGGPAAGAREPLFPAMRRFFAIPTMPQAIFAGLAVSACMDSFAILTPAYGEAKGIPVGTVALLLATIPAASVLARLIMVPMMRVVGRQRLLVLSMLGSGTALGAFPLVNPGLTPLLFVLVSVIGFGLGLGPPLTMMWASWLAPSGDQGLMFGTRQLANRGGQLVMPALSGAVAGVAGIGAVYLGFALLLGGGAWLVKRTSLVDPQASAVVGSAADGGEAAGRV